MHSDLELAFISGRLFDLDDIPKSKKYLYKYFKTEQQRMFVKYVLLHGNHTQFVEHTGIRFRRRWRHYLMRRLRLIEEAWRAAKEGSDLERLAVIEAGKLKVRKK